MKKATINGPIDYRFGEWGPSYLIKDEDFEMGVVRLRPGDAMPNHYHERCDETFIVLEGSCSLWTDRANATELTQGDIASCEPLEQHHLRNDGTEDCRFIFIKTPASPGDTINDDWTPSNS